MIHLIIGGIQSGKTTRMKALWEKSGGDGVLSLKVFEENSFVGYDLLLLSQKKAIPLARITHFSSDCFQFGRFYFSQATFNTGISHLQHAINTKSTPLFLDEVGRLELAEMKGFFPLLNYQYFSENHWYIALRDDFIPLWKQRFPMIGTEIFI